MGILSWGVIWGVLMSAFALLAGANLRAIYYSFVSIICVVCVRKFGHKYKYLVEKDS